MIDQIFNIGRVDRTRETRRVAKVSGTGGSEFAQHLDSSSATEESATTGATQNLSAVAFVLGAQEVDDALARASKGKARAEEILKMLDDLRIDLLMGQVSPAKLHAITRSMQQHRPNIDDPRLTSILDEVDLRARVELAKYGPGSFA